jgi:probable DNA metabolism protein
MVVFRYDKTLEGLLTVVFDAYNRRSFPEVLIGTGEQLPLFAGEVHEVVSDSEKAGRVWMALERKVSKSMCDMLMHVWLSDLSGMDAVMYRYMCKIFDRGISVVTDIGDVDVLRMRQVSFKVGRERLHVIQFARFQKAADGVYFAPVSPVYNVLPLTVSHFCDRFADQMWLVYDIKRKYGYFYNLQTAAEVVLENDELLSGGKLSEAIMADDEKLFQSMWKDYIRALSIKERLNPRLQRQNMPARFWKYMPEK